MTIPKSLEEVQQEIKKRAVTRNLVDQQAHDDKLVEGLRNVPQRQLLEKAQYLENVILPKVEQSTGTESENYKFYRGLQDAILWCLLIMDRYDFLQRKFAEVNMQNKWLQEEVKRYENELLKYTTMEDLLYTDAMDQYKKAVMTRAENLLQKTKQE